MQIRHAGGKIKLPLGESPWGKGSDGGLVLVFCGELVVQIFGSFG